MNVELQNIPAIWTAVAHWLACLLYLNLLPRRCRGWRFWAPAAVFLGVLVAYQGWIYNWSGMAFNIAMTVFAGLTLVPFFLLARTDWRGSIYYCARAFILGGFSVSFAWQIYVFYAQRVAALTGPLGEAGTMLAILLAVDVMMHVMEQGHRQELEQMRIPLSSMLATVLIAFIIYIISSISFAPIETPFGATSDAEIFNVRTLVYMGGLAILFSVHLQLCDAHARQELTAMQNMLNMQYATYVLSQESVDLVNRKYHDLKHQIALLRSDIGNAQKLASLDRMEQEIRAYEAQNKTGNKVLDTILTSKGVQCQNHGIHFTCVADGHALDFLDVMEISTLFGNALDNAIEGVSQLEDPEQRLIHLTVSRQKDFLRIRVENRCRPDLRVEGDLPRTTKRDKNFHGYGLKSIRATAEEYGGCLNLRAENGWFELQILIPVPEKGE